MLGGEASPWHPRGLSIAQSSQQGSHPLQPHGTAQPGGAQYLHGSITSQLCPCCLKRETALLPALHKLEHIAVSSRTSEPPTVCSSRRHVPRERFQRAGTAHSASTWGTCATELGHCEFTPRLSVLQLVRGDKPRMASSNTPGHGGAARRATALPNLTIRNCESWFPKIS